jgi:hypothetical protein
VVGLSQPTLRKVYFSEMAARDIMALKVRSEQLARLTEAAIKGNIAAEKALAGMIQAERLAVQAAAITRRPEAKAPVVGKKEAARVAAGDMAGKFGARTPPPLLIQ